MGRAKKIITLLGTAILLLPTMVSAQNISADGLGGYWLIDGGRVACVDSHGKRKVSYSELLLGNPTEVDATDPFRILVFYRSSQNLLILNNDASPIGKAVDLSTLVQGETQHVARSSLGGVWIATEGENKLVRYDKHLKRAEQVVTIPPKYSQLQLVRLAEHGGNLFVGLDNGHVLVFDTYGALQKENKFEPFDSFLLHANSLYTIKGTQVAEYSLIHWPKFTNTHTCGDSKYLTFFKGELAWYSGSSFTYCEKR